MPRESPISTIVQTPAHELVAEQLQRAILLGRYLPGDRLPSERAMAEQFGVSRTSVREAIHILLEHGLLKIKRGASGGAFVQDMIDDGVREKMISVARRRKKDYAELAEFRLIVECAAARLAAERRTRTDLKALSRYVSRMDTLFAEGESNNAGLAATRFYAEDTAFHIEIAKVSRNKFLLETIEDVRFKMFMPLGRVVAQLDAHANDKHHEIYASIDAGDPDAAARLMGEHIRGSFQSLIGKS